MRRVVSRALAVCLTVVSLAGAVYVFVNADSEATSAMGRAGGPLLAAPAFLTVVGAIWLWTELNDS
jgi:hypothetical protein